jgi:hypothetical protein
MLRLRNALFASVLIATAGIAQNAPDQPTKSGQQQSMAAMRDQMMKSMQADLDTMRSNLQRMKDQLSKVSDQSTKDQLQLNISMWQTMIDNMDKHLTMMKGMMEPGHSMMMHGGQTPTPKK